MFNGMFHEIMKHLKCIVKIPLTVIFFILYFYIYFVWIILGAVIWETVAFLVNASGCGKMDQVGWFDHLLQFLEKAPEWWKKL